MVPVGLARAPVGLPRQMVLRGIRRMFHDPRRVPQSWYEAAADEYFIAMGHAGHRRALISAAINIYTDEPFGANGFWDRLRNLRTPAQFLWAATTGWCRPASPGMSPRRSPRHSRWSSPAAGTYPSSNSPN